MRLANTIPTLRNSIISMWLSRNSDDSAKAEGLDIGDWLLNLDGVRQLRLQDFI